MSISGGDLPNHLLLLTCLRVLTVTSGQNFTHARVSSVRVLAEIMGRYIQLLGTATKSFAEQSGRSSCNIQDALAALDSFGFDAALCEDWLEDLKAHKVQQQLAETQEGDQLVQMCERLLGESPFTRGH